MPLRDHFRPPVSKRSSWEGFHGYWPAAMVKQLGEQLPARFIVEPRVHLGNARASEQYKYQVLIYDVQRDRTLVAAIEIVSPGNKSGVADAADLAERQVCHFARFGNLLRRNLPRVADTVNSEDTDDAEPATHRALGAGDSAEHR